MSNLQPTTMQFSLYDLYKENDSITNHSQLMDRFNNAVSNLKEESRESLNFTVTKKANGENSGFGKNANSTTIIMDSRTALWFSAKLNDELRLAIIDKVEELSNKQLPKPTDNTASLLEAIKTNQNQLQQVIDMMNKPVEAPVAVKEVKPNPLHSRGDINVSQAKQDVLNGTTAYTKVYDLGMVSYKVYELTFEYVNTSFSNISNESGSRRATINTPTWLKPRGKYETFTASVLFTNKGENNSQLSLYNAKHWN